MTEPRDPWREAAEVAVATLEEAERRRLPKVEPRSWSLPPEPPEDVQAVRDREGFVWKRQDAKVWRRSTGAWTDDILRIVVKLGPLTEVVDSE